MFLPQSNTTGPSSTGVITSSSGILPSYFPMSLRILKNAIRTNHTLVHILQAITVHWLGPSRKSCFTTRKRYYSKQRDIIGCFNPFLKNTLHTSTIYSRHLIFWTSKACDSAFNRNFDIISWFLTVRTIPRRLHHVKCILQHFTSFQKKSLKARIFPNSISYRKKMVL